MMKKIYALHGDVNHDDAVTESCLRRVFGDALVFTSEPADIPWDDMENQVELYVSMKETNTTLKPDGTIDQWITPERERALYDFVSNGGSALFVHCGLVGYPTDSLYHKLSGGVFIEQPPIRNVTYVPIKREHPIMEGVENFSGPDEKYFCHIDVADVDIFMCGDDPDCAGTITGWCRKVGKGRTVSVTPGHTFEIVENPNMTRILNNAVKWLKERDE